MGRRRGFSLKELLTAVAVLAILAAAGAPALERAREDSQRIRCRNNMNQLAKGMAIYLNEHGDNRFYPCPLGRCAKGSGADTFSGAEWLASLYWTGVVADPSVFLCPRSGDANAKGKDLGCHSVNDAGGAFGSQTVSYAGMWWKSVVTVNGSVTRDDFPPNEAMASDDTQGGINHNGPEQVGMNILFFDSHVEFKTNKDIDVEKSVGQNFPKPPRTLLWRLKN